MASTNSYVWLNPSRQPVVELAAVFLVLGFMALQFAKAESHSRVFPQWDGHTIQLPQAPLTVHR